MNPKCPGATDQVIPSTHLRYLKSEVKHVIQAVKGRLAGSFHMIPHDEQLLLLSWLLVLFDSSLHP